MPNRLYKRVWKVSAYRPTAGTPNGFIAAHPSYFEGLPNGIEITKLRIQVKIEKNLSGDPNTCEVTITNLNEGERADIVKKPLIVRIDAGYVENGGARHLFTGDLRYGYSKRNGADWETVLQLGDGSRAFAGARISRTYRKGTSLMVALRDAAAGIGVGLPPNIEASSELQAQFPSGRSIHGNAVLEMEKLLAPYGYSCSFQDGRLQILTDESVRADQAYLITQATGLVGSPEIGAPPKDGSAPILTFQTLLYPQITPGGKCDVREEGLDGIFRAERVTHTLDSHGQPWTTEVEAKPQDSSVKFKKPTKQKAY